MKAKIYFKRQNERATCKTIEVEKDDPCSIVREFLLQTRFEKWTYIRQIKCGRRLYMWEDTCYSAYES